MSIYIYYTIKLCRCQQWGHVGHQCILIFTQGCHSTVAAVAEALFCWCECCLHNVYSCIQRVWYMHIHEYIHICVYVCVCNCIPAHNDSIPAVLNEYIILWRKAFKHNLHVFVLCHKNQTPWCISQHVNMALSLLTCTYIVLSKFQPETNSCDCDNDSDYECLRSYF